MPTHDAEGIAESAGPSRGAWAALAVLLIAQALANMDSSIVNVALHTIRVDLPASSGALQLISVGYTLTFGVLVVTGARLGDDYGYRRVFMVGLAGFVVASLLCGLAPTSAVLVAARAVQGLFGALMVPQILSTLQVLFSGVHLARAVGYYTMILALGVAAGQIVGGSIVGANLFEASWRIAFLVNVPVGIAIMLVANAVLPKTGRSQRVRLDLIGVVVLGFSMACLVVPMVFGWGQGWPWWTWATLAAGGFGIVVFVRFELGLLAKGARPLLDLTSMRPAGVKPGLLALFLLNFAFTGIIFPITLHLQSALGYGPLQAGLMFVPYTVGFATVSLTWTRYPQRWHAALPVAGLVLFASSAFGLAITVRAGWPVPVAAVVLCIAGATMAAAMSPLVAQIAGAVGPANASALSALISTGALLFSVLSITTAGGLYLAVAENDVARSADGVSWAFILVAMMLVVAAVCAARTRHAAVRHKPVAGSPSREISSPSPSPRRF